MRKRSSRFILFLALAIIGFASVRGTMKAKATGVTVTIQAVCEKGYLSSTIIPYPEYQAKINVSISGVSIQKGKADIVIQNENNEVIYHSTLAYPANFSSSKTSFTWDGKDNAGLPAGEGNYRVTVTEQGINKSDAASFYLLREPATKPTVKVTNITSTSAKCTWTKVPDADYYMVEIYSGGQCAVRKYVTGTSDTFRNFVADRTYKYSVTAMRKYDGKYYFWSGATTAAVSFHTKYQLNKPTIKLKKKSKTSIQIRWKQNANAKGYQVYMTTTKKGKYKRIANISKYKTVQYTKKKLKRKKTYYFKVRSYVKIAGVTFYSDYSGVKSYKLR